MESDDQGNQSSDYFQENYAPPVLLPTPEEKARLMTADDEDGMKSDGPIRIKLKFRNSSSSECSDHEAGAVKDEENRVCKLCKKGFSSGRALGGHMRVHYQKEELESSNNKLVKKIHHHHPRSSSNPNKDYFSNLSLPKNNLTDNATTTTNTTCSECGKTFPSMKSLFGHMRCHPERDWRGIQPPPPTTTTAKNSSASSTVSDSLGQMKMDDRIHDSATTTSGLPARSDFPSWSVTARRGRRSINMASFNCHDEPIPEAAYDLLLLANGDSLQVANSPNKQRSSEESEATTRASSQSNNLHEDQITDGCLQINSDHSKKRRRSLIEDSSEPPRFVSKKLKIGDGGLYQWASELQLKAEKGNGAISRTHEFDGDQSGSTDSEQDSEQHSGEEARGKYAYHNSYANHQLNPIISEMRRKKKKISLKDLEAVVVHQDKGAIDSDRYKCTTCNKSFSTHQALGGHRSSHNKGRNMNVQQHMEMMEENQTILADGSTEKEQCDYVDEKVEGTHRCQICKKTFPTGQALGGHKRCHWNGPIEAPPISISASVVVQVMKEEAGETTRRPVMEFDLNELPPMEDEGGVVSDSAHFAGYPSSSNNSAT